MFLPGDVLHTYAILGLLLVFGLRRVSDRAIVLLVAACIVYPAVSGTLRVLIFTPEMVAGQVQIAKAFEVTNDAAYCHGGFVDMVNENSRVMTFFYDHWLGRSVPRSACCSPC